MPAGMATRGGSIAEEQAWERPGDWITPSQPSRPGPGPSAASSSSSPSFLQSEAEDGVLWVEDGGRGGSFRSI